MTAPHRARVSAAVLIAVLGLAGNPVGALAQSGAANSRTFQWTAPGDDGNTGRASRYELHYSTTPIDPTADSTALATWWGNQSIVVPGSELPPPSQAGRVDSAVVGNLDYGSTYYFIIRSVDDAQNWSPYSNVASVTLAPCDAPTSTPSAPQTQTDSLGVLVSWPAPEDPLASSVEIYRGSSPGRLAFLGSVSATETSYLDTTTRNGSTYFYALAWAASCGNGSIGSATSITFRNSVSAPAAAQGTSSIRAFPNPATGPLTLRLQIVGGQPQSVRVRLYDANGRWIADLADGTFAAGETELTWNRQTRGGDQAAPGYYEALGTIGSTRVRERLVLLP